MTSPQSVPTLLEIQNRTHQGQVDQGWGVGGSTSLETGHNLTSDKKRALELWILKQPDWEDLAVRLLEHPGVVLKGCLCGCHGLIRHVTWCGDYLCPFCEKKKSGKRFRIARNLVELRMGMAEETTVTVGRGRCKKKWKKGGRVTVFPPFRGELKFITLTKLVFRGSLEGAIADTNENWARFRRQKECKNHITGCLENMEIKWFDGRPHKNTKNPRTTELGWLCHLHFLAECDWWDVEELRASWKAVSGAEQVWISAVDLTVDENDPEAEDWTKIALDDEGGQGGSRPKVSLSKAILEVTKYTLKPMDIDDMSDMARREFQTVMAGGKRNHTRVKVSQGRDLSSVGQINTGRKLMRAFGAWYGIPKVDPEEDGGEGLERFSICERCVSPRFPPLVVKHIGDMMPRPRRNGTIYYYDEDDELEPTNPPSSIKDLITWVFKPIDDHYRCHGCLGHPEPKFVECPRCGRPYCPRCANRLKTCLMCGANLVARVMHQAVTQDQGQKAREGPQEAPVGPCLALMPSDEALALLRMRKRMRGQGRDGWATYLSRD